LPRIPKDLKARTTLEKNLEYMGLGPRLMNFPWSITSTTMVNELTQNQPVPEEVRHVLYQAAIHHITEQTIAQIYGTSSSGDERPAKARNRHKEYFSVEKDSTDGYLVDSFLDSEMRDIFWFLCPILEPLWPDKVHIYRFNQVYLLLWKKVKVNRTQNLYWSMYKSAQQVGVSPQSYLSPFLFHFYDQNNTLTRNEKADYMAAMANVQE
jgi:hypothetical protein